MATEAGIMGLGSEKKAQEESGGIRYEPILKSTEYEKEPLESWTEISFVTPTKRGDIESIALQNTLEVGDGHKPSYEDAIATDISSISQETAEDEVLVTVDTLNSSEGELFIESPSRVQESLEKICKDSDASLHGENSIKIEKEMSESGTLLQKHQIDEYMTLNTAAAATQTSADTSSGNERTKYEEPEPFQIQDFTSDLVGERGDKEEMLEGSSYAAPKEPSLETLHSSKDREKNRWEGETSSQMSVYELPVLQLSEKSLQEDQMYSDKLEKAVVMAPEDIQITSATEMERDAWREEESMEMNLLMRAISEKQKADESNIVEDRMEDKELKDTSSVSTENTETFDASRKIKNEKLVEEQCHSAISMSTIMEVPNIQNDESSNNNTEEPVHFLQEEKGFQTKEAIQKTEEIPEKGTNINYMVEAKPVALGVEEISLQKAVTEGAKFKEALDRASEDKSPEATKTYETSIQDQAFSTVKQERITHSVSESPSVHENENEDKENLTKGNPDASPTSQSLAEKSFPEDINEKLPEELSDLMPEKQIPETIDVSDSMTMKILKDEALVARATEISTVDILQNQQTTDSRLKKENDVPEKEKTDDGSFDASDAKALTGEVHVLSEETETEKLEKTSEVDNEDQFQEKIENLHEMEAQITKHDMPTISEPQAEEYLKENDDDDIGDKHVKTIPEIEPFNIDIPEDEVNHYKDIIGLSVTQALVKENAQGTSEVKTEDYVNETVNVGMIGLKPQKDQTENGKLANLHDVASEGLEATEGIVNPENEIIDKEDLVNNVGEGSQREEKRGEKIEHVATEWMLEDQNPNPNDLNEETETELRKENADENAGDSPVACQMVEESKHEQGDKMHDVEHFEIDIPEDDESRYKDIIDLTMTEVTEKGNAQGTHGIKNVEHANEAIKEVTLDQGPKKHETEEDKLANPFGVTSKGLEGTEGILNNEKETIDEEDLVTNEVDGSQEEEKRGEEIEKVATERMLEDQNSKTDDLNNETESGIEMNEKSSDENVGDLPIACELVGESIQEVRGEMYEVETFKIDKLEDDGSCNKGSIDLSLTEALEKANAEGALEERTKEQVNETIKEEKLDTESKKDEIEGNKLTNPFNVVSVGLEPTGGIVNPEKEIINEEDLVKDMEKGSHEEEKRGKKIEEVVAELMIENQNPQTNDLGEEIEIRIEKKGEVSSENFGDLPVKCGLVEESIHEVRGEMNNVEDDKSCYKDIIGLSTTRALEMEIAQGDPEVRSEEYVNKTVNEGMVGLKPQKDQTEDGKLANLHDVASEGLEATEGIVNPETEIIDKENLVNNVGEGSQREEKRGQKIEQMAAEWMLEDQNPKSNDLNEKTETEIGKEKGSDENVGDLPVACQIVEESKQEEGDEMHEVEPFEIGIPEDDESHYKDSTNLTGTEVSEKGNAQGAHGVKNVEHANDTIKEVTLDQDPKKHETEDDKIANPFDVASEGLEETEGILNTDKETIDEEDLVKNVEEGPQEGEKRGEEIEKVVTEWMLEIQNSKTDDLNKETKSGIERNEKSLDNNVGDLPIACELVGESREKVRGEMHEAEPFKIDKPEDDGSCDKGIIDLSLTEALEKENAQGAPEERNKEQVNETIKEEKLDTEPKEVEIEGNKLTNSFNVASKGLEGTEGILNTEKETIDEEDLVKNVEEGPQEGEKRGEEIEKVATEWMLEDQNSKTDDLNKETKSGIERNEKSLDDNVGDLPIACELVGESREKVRDEMHEVEPFKIDKTEDDGSCNKGIIDLSLTEALEKENAQGAPEERNKEQVNETIKEEKLDTEPKENEIEGNKLTNPFDVVSKGLEGTEGILNTEKETIDEEDLVKNVEEGPQEGEKRGKKIEVVAELMIENQNSQTNDLGKEIEIRIKNNEVSSENFGDLPVTCGLVKDSLHEEGGQIHEVEDDESCYKDIIGLARTGALEMENGQGPEVKIEEHVDEAINEGPKDRGPQNNEAKVDKLATTSNVKSEGLEATAANVKPEKGIIDEEDLVKDVEDGSQEEEKRGEKIEKVAAELMYEDENTKTNDLSKETKAGTEKNEESSDENVGDLLIACGLVEEPAQEEGGEIHGVEPFYIGMLEDDVSSYNDSTGLSTIRASEKENAQRAPEVMNKEQVDEPINEGLREPGPQNEETEVYKPVNPSNMASEVLEANEDIVKPENKIIVEEDLVKNEEEASQEEEKMGEKIEKEATEFMHEVQNPNSNDLSKETESGIKKKGESSDENVGDLPIACGLIEESIQEEVGQMHETAPSSLSKEPIHETTTANNSIDLSKEETDSENLEKASESVETTKIDTLWDGDSIDREIGASSTLKASIEEITQKEMDPEEAADHFYTTIKDNDGHDRSREVAPAAVAEKHIHVKTENIIRVESNVFGDEQTDEGTVGRSFHSEKLEGHEFKPEQVFSEIPVDNKISIRETSTEESPELVLKKEEWVDKKHGNLSDVVSEMIEMAGGSFPAEDVEQKDLMEKQEEISTEDVKEKDEESFHEKGEVEKTLQLEVAELETEDPSCKLDGRHEGISEMVDLLDNIEPAMVEDEDNLNKNVGDLPVIHAVIEQAICEEVGEKHDEAPISPSVEQIYETTSTKDTIEIGRHKETAESGKPGKILESTTRETEIINIGSSSDSQDSIMENTQNIKGSMLETKDHEVTEASESMGSPTLEEEEDGATSVSSLKQNVAGPTSAEEESIDAATSGSCLKHNVTEKEKLEKAYELDSEGKLESINMEGHIEGAMPKKEETSNGSLEKSSNMENEKAADVADAKHIKEEEEATKGTDSACTGYKMVGLIQEDEEEQKKLKKAAAESVPNYQSNEANEENESIKNRIPSEKAEESDVISVKIMRPEDDGSQSKKIDAYEDQSNEPSGAYKENTNTIYLSEGIENASIKDEVENPEKELVDLPVTSAFGDASSCGNLHGDQRKSKNGADDTTGDGILNQEVKNSDLTPVGQIFGATVETEPAKIETPKDLVKDPDLLSQGNFETTIETKPNEVEQSEDDRSFDPMPYALSSKDASVAVSEEHIFTTTEDSERVERAILETENKEEQTVETSLQTEEIEDENPGIGDEIQPEVKPFGMINASENIEKDKGSEKDKLESMELGKSFNMAPEGDETTSEKLNIDGDSIEKEDTASNLEESFQKGRNKMLEEEALALEPDSHINEPISVVDTTEKAIPHEEILKTLNVSEEIKAMDAIDEEKNSKTVDNLSATHALVEEITKEKEGKKHVKDSTCEPEVQIDETVNASDHMQFNNLEDDGESKKLESPESVHKDQSWEITDKRTCKIEKSRNNESSNEETNVLSTSPATVHENMQKNEEEQTADVKECIHVANEVSVNMENVMASEEAPESRLQTKEIGLAMLEKAEQRFESIGTGEQVIPAKNETEGASKSGEKIEKKIMEEEVSVKVPSASYMEENTAEVMFQEDKKDEEKYEDKEIKWVPEATDIIENEIRNEEVKESYCLPSEQNLIMMALTEMRVTAASVEEKDPENNLNVSSVTIASAEETMQEKEGEKLDSLPEESTQETSNANLMITEFEKKKKIGAKGSTEIEKHEHTYVDSESIHKIFNGNIFADDVNVQGERVPDRPSNVLLATEASGKDTIDQEDKAKQAEASTLVSKQQADENNSSCEVTKDEKDSHTLSIEQAIGASLTIEQRESMQLPEEASHTGVDFDTSQNEENQLIDLNDLPVSRVLMDLILQEEANMLGKDCDVEPEDAIQEKNSEVEHNDINIPKQEDISDFLYDEQVTAGKCISENKVEGPPHLANTSHSVHEEQSHEVKENTENAIAKDDENKQSNLCNSSSAFAVGEVEKKEEGSSSLSEAPTHVVTPQLANTSGLVHEEQGNDVKDDTENAIAKDAGNQLSNLCDSSPIFAMDEDVKKEEGSGLLSEASTHVVTNDTKDPISAEQSNTESKVDIEEFMNLDLVHDEKIHETALESKLAENAVKNDNESLNKDVDVSSVIKVSREKILQKGGAEGEEFKQDVEKLDKASYTMSEEQTPIDESLGSTKSLAHTEETLLKPQDTTGKSLESSIIQDQKQREALESEFEVKELEHKEENQDGITENTADNVKEDSTKEPKASNSDKVQQSSIASECATETVQVAEYFSEERSPTVSTHEVQSEEATNVQVEEEKIDEENDEKKDEQEHKAEESGSDAAVVLEGRDLKPAHKKSNIFSGVGSKVKHSIAKVKKAITGKSPHPKPISQK